MFGKLHHIAYRCRDAQRTVDFYTKVIGLKYVAGLVPPENSKPSWPLNEPGQPARKVIGDQADSIHIFFELGDGSYLAFFDVPGGGDDSTDPTPWWVKHIAFEVEDMNALLEGKKRLEAHGVQVLGPKDHGLCQSIYFMDPDGHRLEMAVRTETADTWKNLERDAQKELARWNDLKRRKYGPLPASYNAARERIPAMPEDSTIAPA